MAVDSVNDLNRLLVSPSDNGQVDPDRARRRLKKATQAFEAVFVKQLLGQMRKSMTGSSLFGSGQQAGMYQDMMDDALSSQISKSGSFGLASKLYKTMEKSLNLTPAAAAQPTDAPGTASAPAVAPIPGSPVRNRAEETEADINESVAATAEAGKQEGR